MKHSVSYALNFAFLMVAYSFFILSCFKYLIHFHATKKHGLVILGCDEYRARRKFSLINVDKFRLWFLIT